MVDSDRMEPAQQLIGVRFLNFLIGKLSQEFKLHGLSMFHEIQMAIFLYCVALQSGNSLLQVHADMTLT